MHKDKLTVNVKEMSKMLGISRKGAYELTRTKGFPVLRLNRRILIPIIALNEWIKSNVSTQNEL